ncbi:diphosphomevalonate decarboxylase [Candidatus Micrarchaeota archaeon]|nr:diphosphomevalonate decarboxylase [Candidatus Micrarchaeota archaeon]
MGKYAKVIATPNIAVIKYWGKRNEKLMLPTNSSLSFTMDETLKTQTEIQFDAALKEDSLILDGTRLAGKEFEGVAKVLAYVREKYGQTPKAKITSKNHFPTAAGLASSASGYAALAVSINAALKLDLDGSELSIIARLGSGSASRSVYGGFVEWQKGSKQDGSDSIAVQIANENHWPKLRNVIAIVDQEKKKVSSRAGMAETVATSKLFKERLEFMDQRVEKMKKHVLDRDFESFANLAMLDSDNMHACMADTTPRIVYLNDVSRKIMTNVRSLNDKETICGYTFDAGPNAHLYTLEKNVPAIQKMLSKIAGVREILVCKVGNGPRILEKG